MNVIARPRAGGKTHAIIERMLVDPNLIMVSATQRTSEMAKSYPHARTINAERFITLLQVHYYAQGRTHVHFAFDDVDIMLGHLLQLPWGTSIDLATMTGHAE